MAYQIDRYNNTVLTIVEDGTVDQTTDLKFIGKNYAGYGEIQNENFLYLLENFSGANQPPRPLSGQVWFDSANSKLKFYDGANWRTTGGSEVGTLEPTGLSQGDFWWDSANNQLYVYDGTDFVLIGPQNVGSGVTQMVSTTVVDSVGGNRNIICGIIDDEVVHTISATEFDLGPSQPTGSPNLDGFDRIKKGLTLKWTKNADAGVTNSALVSGRDYRWWGTASNADKLGGVVASDFLQKSDANFGQTVSFADVGFTVGEGLDLRIYIENGNVGVIENQSGVSNVIRFKTSDSAGDPVTVLNLDSDATTPGSDNSYDLGTAVLRFGNVYGVNFIGEASKATSLRVGSDFRTASVSATNNTVAVRDATGNLAANLFQGTATSARYADLAEVYDTDQEYPVGTVIAVGGEKEARSAKVSDFVIGVISDKPAYLMNSDAEGQAVGLKGRVPVRVKGPVSKGQAVYAWQDGVASTIASNGLVGIALESNDEEGEKLVECVLKV